MAVDLKEYHEQLDALDRACAARSKRVLPKRARSCRRKDCIIAGRCQGSVATGRGNELVITYIQAMPTVVKQSAKMF